MINKQTTLDLNGPIISFTQNPNSVSVNNGGSATFSGIATATFPVQTPTNPATNSGSIAYQWYASGAGALSDGQFRGATLSGTATTTLTVSGAVSPTTSSTNFFLVASYTPSAYSQPTGSPVTAGTARSTGRDIAGGVQSGIATLTVNPFITITSQPGIATAATSGQAVFNVEASLSDSSFGTLSYQWQLNDQNITDSTSPLIQGSQTKTLIYSPTTVGTYNVKVIITNPTTGITTTSNTVTLNVVNPRSIIVFEGYTPQNVFQKVEVNLDTTSNYSLSDSTFSSTTNIITFYASEKDIDTQMDIRSAKGSDNGSNVGGNGGASSIRLTLKKNEEHTVLGIPDNSGVFLYRGSSLIAVIGKGGDAGSTGNGGTGGGVSNAGGNGSGVGAGVGGSKIADGTLSSAGIFGSNSTVALQNILSGDSKADIPNGGKTIPCSKGSYWTLQGISPCSNNGLTQFRNTNGTLISQSALITRGFKPGYTINVTEGKAIGSGGNGGNGATGGAGGNSAGGGGGSGYTNGSVTILSSTAGGNNSAKSTINLKIYVAPTPTPAPAPAPAPSPSPGGDGSYEYYYYRYGGGGGASPACPIVNGVQTARKGRWFKSQSFNISSTQTVVKYMPNNTKVLQVIKQVNDTYLQCLNRSVGVDEVENGANIITSSGVTTLRNNLLSSAERKYVVGEANASNLSAPFINRPNRPRAAYQNQSYDSTDARVICVETTAPALQGPYSVDTTPPHYTASF